MSVIQASFSSQYQSYTPPICDIMQRSMLPAFSLKVTFRVNSNPGSNRFLQNIGTHPPHDMASQLRQHIHKTMRSCGLFPEFGGISWQTGHRAHIRKEFYVFILVYLLCLLGKKTHNGMWGKSCWKAATFRNRQKWKNNIKMHFREMCYGSVNYIWDLLWDSLPQCVYCKHTTLRRNAENSLCPWKQMSKWERVISVSHSTTCSKSTRPQHCSYGS